MDASGAVAAADAVQLNVLYWAIAIALVVVTGLFRAIGMRGRLNQEWGARVAVIEAGLDEQAVQELRRLRAKIDDLLGGIGQPFDPLSVVVNPSDLLEPVRRFERLLKARRRARTKLRRLLQLGTTFTICGLALLPSIAVVAVHLSGLAPLPNWIWAGTGCGVIALAIGTAGFFLLWSYQDGLAKAEILSQTKVTSDG